MALITPCVFMGSESIIDWSIETLNFLSYAKHRAVLRRRKNSGFHPEIWLYSGILVILNNYKNATVQPNFLMKSEIFPSPQYYPNYKDGSFPLLMRTTTKKGQVKGILDPIGSNPKKRANAVQSMFKSTKACFFESAAIILPNESLSVAAATAVPLPSRIQLEEGTK
jgi:hypothetical protein